MISLTGRASREDRLSQADSDVQRSRDGHHPHSTASQACRTPQSRKAATASTYSASSFLAPLRTAILDLGTVVEKKANDVEVETQQQSLVIFKISKLLVGGGCCSHLPC